MLFYLADAGPILPGNPDNIVRLCSYAFVAYDTGYTDDGDQSLATTGSPSMVMRDDNDAAIVWAELGNDAMYGIRMDGCVRLIDAVKNLDDGNDWTRSSSDASYMSDLDMIAVAADPDLNQVRTYVLDASDMSLLAGPVLVDSSTAIKDVIVQGYYNLYTVYWTNTGTNVSSRVIYNQNAGVAGTKTDWHDTAAARYTKSTRLWDDDSKYIGMFFLNDTGVSATRRLHLSVLSSISSSVVIGDIEISRTQDEIGIAPKPVAICPYKFDDSGHKAGFFMVYSEGLDVKVKFSNRGGGELSDAVILTSGDGDDFGAWSCCETYDLDYLIIGHKAGALGTGYFIWLLDRDLNIITNKEQVLYITNANVNKIEIAQAADNLTYQVMAKENRLSTHSDKVRVMVLKHEEL